MPLCFSSARMASLALRPYFWRRASSPKAWMSEQGRGRSAQLRRCKGTGQRPIEAKRDSLLTEERVLKAEETVFFRGSHLVY